MTSLFGTGSNTVIETLDTQRCSIFNCMNAISLNMADGNTNCESVNALLSQLEYLIQIYFTYDESIIGEMDYSSVKIINDMHKPFMSSIIQFKSTNTLCHTPNRIIDFIQLRLDFSTLMLNETKIITDIIHKHSLTDVSVTMH